ncbi:MAG: quinone oxidoreductase [Sphingomicrobium sp.]
MKATRAIVRHIGGPEAIEWEEVEIPPPGPGEVLVGHQAVGLNFIDIYHRSGVYPIEMPALIGLEAAGHVLAAGAGAEWREGDRVATFGPQRGAYATARIVAADNLLAIPDSIDSEVAAAVLLKGCTTEFLVERCGKVEAGWDVLVHAAAGGVGTLLVQWLKAVGARVIGTVSTKEKAALARGAGADDVILYGHEEVAPRVRELTGGAGVRVTFDGVGRDTWAASIASTGRRGLVACYGNASAPVGEVDFGSLAAAGSLFATRPTLFDYYATPDERRAGVARLWAMVASGAVKPEIGARYPLRDAARAHRDLEARRTTGSVLLIP